MCGNSHLKRIRIIMIDHRFETFLESLKTNDNISLIESIKHGFIACFEAAEDLDINKALATLGEGNKDFTDRLRGLLQVKFKEIESVLKSLLRPAIKGPRKGQLIFPSDSANKIYDIKDEFIQYVVRAIYDNYSDIRNGVMWRMHYNYHKMFSGDFVYGLMTQLNEKIQAMQEKIDEVKDFYKKQRYALQDDEHKFSTYYRRSIADNVFNDKESDYWKNVRELKAKVKREHPRVPDDKLSAYISKTYSYNQEANQIKDDFLKSFPEYVDIQNERQKLWDDESRDVKIMKDQINEELKKVDYENVKKVINAMIRFFIEEISKKIINNTLNI